ncbi:MAG: acyl-CoA dehydrogenase, partial [Alphaproteobacteria bacterium HGW-Alphaproteobacteria-6]
VAEARTEIEMCRLLTLKAADAMDRYGNKVAKDLIAAIKIVAPQMAQTVADRAIQSFGAMGVSGDAPVAAAFMNARYLRLADGPDEVHLAQLGKLKITEYNNGGPAR